MTNSKDTSIYSRERVSSVAPTIYTQLPEWVNTSFSNFSEFLNHYYKFIATDTEIDLVLDNMSVIKAVGETDSALIDSLYAEFANYIPSGHPDGENAPSRRELLLKIVATLYNSRGTSESAKKFFSFFYNDHTASVVPYKTEDFSLNIFNDTDPVNRPKSKLWEPYAYVIRTSANIDEWYDSYIKIIHPIGYYLISLITHEAVAGKDSDTEYDVLNMFNMFPNQMNNPLNWRRLDNGYYDFYWDWYKYARPAHAITFNYASLIHSAEPVIYVKPSDSYEAVEYTPTQFDDVGVFQYQDEPVGFSVLSYEVPPYTGNIFEDPSHLTLSIGGDTLSFGDGVVTLSDVSELMENYAWLNEIMPTYGADHCPTVQPGLLKRVTVSALPQVEIIPLNDPINEGEWGAFIIKISDPYIQDEEPAALDISFNVVEPNRGALAQNNWLDEGTWTSDKSWTEGEQPEVAINTLTLNDDSYDESFVLAQGFWDDDHEGDGNIWNDDAVISFDGFEYSEDNNLDRYDFSLASDTITFAPGVVSSYDGTTQEAIDDFEAWIGDSPSALSEGIFAFPTFTNQSSYKSKVFTVRAEATLSTNDGFNVKSEAVKTFTINNITEFPPIPDGVAVFKTNSLQA